MSWIFVVLAAIAGGLIGGNGKRKLKEDNQLLRQKLGLGASSQKTGKEKTILDIMEDIAYHDELDQFKLVESKGGSTVYTYKNNGYTFNVRADYDYTSCQILHKEEIVLHFTYDNRRKRYEKKNIFNSVMDGKSREEAVQIIEDFMEEIIDYDWEEFDKSMVIINDKKHEEVNEETTGLEGLKRKISRVEDEEIRGKFKTIISTIEYVSKDLMDIVNMDVSKKHLFENTMQQDVMKLYNSYQKLDEKGKENYKSEVIDGLKRVENELEKFTQQVKEKNEIEIEKQLLLMKKRYDD